MRIPKNIATYRRLREQSLWKLLAADHAPVVIGILQSHLFEKEKRLPASVFYERVEQDIEYLRAAGEDFTKPAQYYIANWLRDGYLERTFPLGATEEEYELSTATIDAIRIASGLEQPRTTATESRLDLVIKALARLTEDTDTDKHRRIERLMKDQARINKEIDAIQNGQMKVLPALKSLERVREIIALAENLTNDFRRVRDKFENLNRDLRTRIVDSDGNRGVVLDSLFAGIDLIAESEAGMTFTAFWRLLTDPEQSAILDHSLDSIMSRDFTSLLEPKERQFLLRLMRTLLEQGGLVHDVQQSFARSLKHFVQSQEYIEHRRLNQLLRECQSTALTLKDGVRLTESLAYKLDLSSIDLCSFSQLNLHDPSLQASPASMEEGDILSISLDAVAGMVAFSDIDFRTLKKNVLTVLDEQSQASICDIVNIFPAKQGLGSIVGLIALGSRHGFKTEIDETVTWIGSDQRHRSARIPKIFFLRERANELSKSRCL